MKHLKLFESFREEDIDNICKEYDIRNYTINEDGSIDIDGNVGLYGEKLTKLPLKFRNVSGYFDCSNNKLTTLKGCPKSVGGFFICEFNNLTSLEGCPETVGSKFDCSDNLLTTLEGGPISVGGFFICESNNLTSLEGCPKSVGSHFNCSYNNIVTFEHLPFSIGGKFYCSNNPIWEIWDLFEDYSKIEFLNDCDAIRDSDENSKKPIIILDRLNFFLEEIGKEAVTEVKGYKCI